MKQPFTQVGNELSLFTVDENTRSTVRENTRPSERTRDRQRAGANDGAAAPPPAAWTLLLTLGVSAPGRGWEPRPGLIRSGVFLLRVQRQTRW